MYNDFEASPDYENLNFIINLSKSPKKIVIVGLSYNLVLHANKYLKLPPLNFGSMKKIYKKKTVYILSSC